MSASVYADNQSSISYTTQRPAGFTPIVKYQTWNAKVMANIWSVRDTLDPGQLSHIKALYDNAKAHNKYNTSVFTYSYPKSSIGRLGYGRLYSQEKGGMEKIEKTLRHSLCAGIYWDIDMVNAQPTILSQMANNRDLDLPNLTNYVLYRDEIIQKLMSQFGKTRDEVKEWIITCIFGARIPELECLQKELRTLANELRSEYNELYETIIKQKEANVIGTFLAYIGQTEECRCLMAMNDYFIQKGRSVDIFCYDGCMVRRINDEENFSEELLREAEEYVKKITGYQITLAIKPMKCSEDFMKEAKPLRKEDIDDTYMVRKFLHKMGDNIINDTQNGIMIFDDKTGMWFPEDTDGEGRKIRNYIIKADLKEETMDGTVNYSGYANKQDAIIKILPSMIDLVDFCTDSKFSTAENKLLFLDGIYDMVTKTFTSGFNRDILFTGRIKRKFPARNEDLIAKVNKLLFEDPYKETEQDVGVYLKKLLARGIGGNYHDKTMVIVVGESNSGKGLLSFALENTFGTNITTYAAANLQFRGNNVDDAKKYSWVCPIRNSRISIANEVSTATGGSNSACIDGNVIKSLTGGDKTQMRQNFMNEEAHRNRALMLLFLNDLPQIKPLDDGIGNRAKIGEYKLTFVEKPEGQPLEHFERRAIPNVKKLFENTEYQDAFFWCLMDAFECNAPTAPATALASAKEWVPAPKQSFKDALTAAGYRIDKDDNNIFVAFSEIKQVLKDAGVCAGMSDQAIGRELNKIGLESGEKRIDGRVTKIRKNIQLI